MHSVTSGAVFKDRGKYQYTLINTQTDIRDLENGYYFFSTASMNNLLNKPSWWESGSCYVLVGKLSDENFILVICPRNARMSICIQYGSWQAWRDIAIS